MCEAKSMIESEHFIQTLHFPKLWASIWEPSSETFIPEKKERKVLKKESLRMKVRLLIR